MSYSCTEDAASVIAGTSVNGRTDERVLLLRCSSSDGDCVCRRPGPDAADAAQGSTASVAWTRLPHLPASALGAWTALWLQAC